MLEYGEGHRTLAASCWKEAKGDQKAATADFTNRAQNLGMKVPAAASKFVSKWGQCWDSNGNCDGEASNSGRKRKLADKEALQVVEDLKNWRQFEVAGPFSSIRQLLKTSTRSREILQAAEASASTVTRMISKVAPELAYEKLDIKQKMTAAQTQARYSTADKHQHIPVEKLGLVVWIDAKLICCTIRNRKGWVVHTEKVPFETSRPPGKKNQMQLRYYVGVCARAGKVFLKFVTGTTGFKPQRTYRVSVAVGQAMCSFPCLPAAAFWIASSIALRQRLLRPRLSPGINHTTWKPCRIAPSAGALSLPAMAAQSSSPALLLCSRVSGAPSCCSPCTAINTLAGCRRRTSQQWLPRFTSHPSNSIAPCSACTSAAYLTMQGI